MAARETGIAVVADPEWKQLKYPDEDTFIRLLDAHPHLVYSDETQSPRNYYALAPWLRLEWPDATTYKRAVNTKAASLRYPEAMRMYASPEDAALVISRWPDCFGEPLVEVALIRVHTINDQEYEGRVRVPQSVAASLRWADEKARQEVIKAVLPKNHPDRSIVLPGGGDAA